MNAKRQMKLGNCHRRIKHGCMDGHSAATENSDNVGILRFDCKGYGDSEQLFELLPVR